MFNLNTRRVLSRILYGFLFVSFLWASPKVPSVVLRILDGDTYKVRLLDSGNVERVRLIGIDTPESSPNKKAYRDIQRIGRDLKTIIELGKQATAFAKTLVHPGDTVFLEFDVQKRDTYGRLLAYVWLTNGRMVNEVLVREGYAQIYTFPPNVKYQERFLEAQREARKEGKGLWAGITSPVAPDSEEAPYVASRRSRVFHYKWCPHAQKIKPSNRVYFKTREEAIKSGRRPCQRCQP